MMEIIAKIITSKTGISIILIILALLGLVIAWQVKTTSMENKISNLQKTVDTQDETIVQLTRELEEVNFELKTVQKGLTSLEDYTKKEREILEDGDKTKTDLLEAVTTSKENQDWWNTNIPDDLLNALLCN